MVADTDAELEVLGASMDEIERARGLSDDESFHVGDGPAGTS